MRSIGAQVNYTTGSEAVMRAFDSHGGEVYGTQLKSLANLLARGIRVALIHGDADIICNWYGGENASLELAELMPGYRDIFPTAGPETAFTVFSRIIQGDDPSTDKNIDLSTFRSEGIPDSMVHRNEVPPIPDSICWIRDQSSCRIEQVAAIQRGEGVVNGGIWSPGPGFEYSPERYYNAPKRHDARNESAAPELSATVALTGVFTATALPAHTTGLKSAASRNAPAWL
ncbi:hypothetical protein HBI26_061150 [Parastagonospora nodorum]|nr:hypothetical protein HBI26_061150 [Parastagonospora nodorum]